LFAELLRAETGLAPELEQRAHRPRGGLVRHARVTPSGPSGTGRRPRTGRAPPRPCATISHGHWLSATRSTRSVRCSPTCPPVRRRPVSVDSCGASAGCRRSRIGPLGISPCAQPVIAHHRWPDGRPFVLAHMLLDVLNRPCARRRGPGGGARTGGLVAACAGSRMSRSTASRNTPLLHLAMGTAHSWEGTWPPPPASSPRPPRQPAAAGCPSIQIESLAHRALIEAVPRSAPECHSVGRSRHRPRRPRRRAARPPTGHGRARPRLG
jgi:hypothetical protein